MSKDWTFTFKSPLFLFDSFYPVISETFFNIFIPSAESMDFQAIKVAEGWKVLMNNLYVWLEYVIQ